MIEGRLKRGVFGGLRTLGIIAISQGLANGVPVLAYHGVTERKDSPLGNVRRLHVWRGRFEEHLRALSSRWHPVPLSTVAETMKMGRALPPRSVAVTIDDGYRNVLTVALPLLRRFGVPATVFVVTGAERRLWVDRLEAAFEATSLPLLRWAGQTFPLTSDSKKVRAVRAVTSMLSPMGAQRAEVLERIFESLGHPSEESDDDRDLLSWDDVRELRRAGLEIGSHADRHEPLTERPSEDARSALVHSRRTLESELGAGRYALSYPYGAWNHSIATAAREGGFSCAVTTDPGLNSVKGDVFSLKRLLVGADDDMTRLRASLSGLRAFCRWNRDSSIA